MHDDACAASSSSSPDEQSPGQSLWPKNFFNLDEVFLASISKELEGPLTIERSSSVSELELPELQPALC